MINKLKKIFFISFAFLFLAFIFYARKRLFDRENNSVIAEGTIIEKGHRAKTDSYVAYTFIVDGKKYIGSVPIQFCKVCEKECCAIGAKVKVRYEKTNPNNNDLIH
ncbi:MAG TPA: hypothetical protein VL307_16565 [Chitinophagaceae bacterium]|jgi:hypothetical protein|nr:hypothetical protein [Chitinophagaceae bacterium]